jgi:hypothetical protein
MDWSSIAGLVGRFAPTLGGLLGGAFGPGGAFIGSKVGGIIAAALGKNAVKRLEILERTRGAEIEAQARIEIARLEANVAQGGAINETQRVEIAQGVSWWHWRHLIGYCTLLFGMIFAAGTAKIMFMGGDTAALTALINAVTPIFLTLAALNGYIAADNTNRVNTAITGQHSAGGIMNTIRGVLPAKK